MPLKAFTTVDWATIALSAPTVTAFSTNPRPVSPQAMPRSSSTKPANDQAPVTVVSAFLAAPDTGDLLTDIRVPEPLLGEAVHTQRGSATENRLSDGTGTYHSIMTEHRKIRSRIVVAATATLLAVPLTVQTAPASAAPEENLVENGTFVTNPTLSGVTWRNNGPAAPWQKAGAGYDLLSADFAQHPNGYQAVDLGPEFTGGGIQQRLTPDPGAWYRLSFQHSPDAWGNCVGQNVDFTVEFADDDGTTVLSADIKPHDADGKAHWRKSVLRTFKAYTDTLFLKFKGNTSTSCQAAITNVKVIEVG